MQTRSTHEDTNSYEGNQAPQINSTSPFNQDLQRKRFNQQTSVTGYLCFIMLTDKRNGSPHKKPFTYYEGTKSINWLPKIHEHYSTLELAAANHNSEYRQTKLSEQYLVL